MFLILFHAFWHLKNNSCISWINYGKIIFCKNFSRTLHLNFIKKMPIPTRIELKLLGQKSYNLFTRKYAIGSSHYSCVICLLCCNIAKSYPLYSWDSFSKYLKDSNIKNYHFEHTIYRNLQSYNMNVLEDITIFKKK